MANYIFKLLPIFLVHIISLSAQQHYLLQNVFVETSPVKTGDKLECLVSETNPSESTIADTHVYTQNTPDDTGFNFYPLAKDQRCFSFQVRGGGIPHIILSSTAAVPTDPKLEIIIRPNAFSVIRSADKDVTQILLLGIVTPVELRGFWVRWVDNQLLEIGQNFAVAPMLSYKLSKDINANFIGIRSEGGDNDWIIHEDVQCGYYLGTEKIEADSTCNVVTASNTEKLDTLQKSQDLILHQIRMQNEVFKLNKLRTKENLLSYMKAIRKNYLDAQKNQQQIIDLDQKIYWPIEGKTFSDVAKVYFPFLEEIQMELSTFLAALQPCAACP